MIFNFQTPARFRFAEEDPLPPVMVKLFNTKEPDPKIQEAMDKLESGRDSIEQAMFKKAELELKLITTQTLDELQQNINSEVRPYNNGKDARFKQIETAHLKK